MEIIDNFLPDSVFRKLQRYTSENEFRIFDAGDKAFSVLDTPDFVLKYLESNDKEIILSFIRRAYSEFDNELRIHTDYIIKGEKPSEASVLYINNEKGVSTNGTAMWKHIKYGEYFDGSEDEFNDLLLNDSNDLSKFKLTDLVFSKPNRLLVYDANRFHSKYPSRIVDGVRIVLVTFYKDKNI